MKAVNNEIAFWKLLKFVFICTRSDTLMYREFAIIIKCLISNLKSND